MDRGGYYDQSGALKDMVQNHILQVLSILAMDKPASFSSADVLPEKIKVLESLRLPDEQAINTNFIRGQYQAGQINNQDYQAYIDEPSVASESKTETFASGVFFVDTARFQDVPFFFRTGKRLTEKGTRINIIFKNNANIFEQTVTPNILTIYIQPTEGFSLQVNGKEVGKHFSIEPVKLDFRHDADALGNSPEAYEKLIYDVLNGDVANFSRWQEVKASWTLIDKIVNTWQADKAPLHYYPAGSMGPIESFNLLKKYDTNWIWQPDVWYRERDLLK